MEEQEKMHLSPPFDEAEWIRLIFLLNDTQKWLDELVRTSLLTVPIKGRKKLLRRTYYTTVKALAHILERHYFKIPRHPNTGKFTIPVIDILSLLRDASMESSVPIAGSNLHIRTIDTGKTIGYSSDQLPTQLVSVLTDSGGRIVTAFPGLMKTQTIIANS